jgi:hypothetical protein
MLKKEIKLRAGVYKVKTFRTTQIIAVLEKRRLHEEVDLLDA